MKRFRIISYRIVVWGFTSLLFMLLIGLFGFVVLFVSTFYALCTSAWQAGSYMFNGLIALWVSIFDITGE